MSECNPIDHINRIQKIKYKQALLPIILIVASFLISFFYENEMLKYAALFGLIWYVWIFMQFKIIKIPLPENSENSLLSPITGKVIDLNEAELLLKKSWLNSVEIRCIGKNEKITINWTKEPVLFESDCSLPGRLIGFVKGKTICKITFPKHYELNVVCGQKIEAGNCILKKKEEDGKADK